MWRWYVGSSRRSHATSKRTLKKCSRTSHPEGELHSAIVGGAEGNVYRGHEGFRRWVADSFDSFEGVRNEWSEFRDLGNRVLALGHVRARGRGSGMELDSAMGWVFTVRRGKVVKAEGFLRRAEALKAARRRE